ncbi:MAG: HAMP domain-containing histidine kinase [Fibrobacteria bacterium]|nr:HAMP domain-containing histidine kinase [Fibrobacteria bacterium]
MRFRSINFQLQAITTIVTIGSILLLGMMFRVTHEISYRTNQLFKSAELNALIKEWETELNIGIRSRIKFISLRRPIFLSNYHNSILRINELNNEIQEHIQNFAPSVKNVLKDIQQEQEKYSSLASTLDTKALHQKKFKQQLVLLQQMEEEIKQNLENFFQITMVNVRKNNLHDMELTLSTSKKLVLLSMVSFIVINILIWLLLKTKILVPLKILEQGAKEIGEGALGLQISVKTKNEIFDLVQVLNKMSIQLKKNQDAEVKLQKLETIGQVVTSVNHEINNPLMIISGNAEYLKKLLGDKHEKVSKKLNIIIKESNRIFEVTQKLKELKNPIVEKYVGEESTMIDIKRST